ncbi:hypothetical protein ACIRU3_01240 [Streptomyces sp. NPDC101151]|uniref:hypothetical protein n=1 Tax=Streptomyces sp. NPDC101151 TaxID=3366115 RepID=UPI0037FB4D0E
MTLPAALFGTAVRLPRTTAGRRALQLALLVGGLFLLGFLSGEQAHAAEGTPIAPVSSPRPVAGQADAVRTVTERVVTPVREVVQSASGAVEQTRAEAPTPPTAPSVPVPELPGASEVPVPPLPVPVTPDPRPHRHDRAAPPSDKADRVRTEARTEARTAVPAGSSATAYGPDFATSAHAPHAPQAPAHTPARPTTAPVDAPAQPAPTGDPDGVLGKQAADGTATRHGDAHAVTPDGRAPLRLPPGAAARVDAPRTRERHRDIPVFPG